MTGRVQERRMERFHSDAVVGSSKMERSDVMNEITGAKNTAG